MSPYSVFDPAKPLSADGSELEDRAHPSLIMAWRFLGEVLENDGSIADPLIRVYSPTERAFIEEWTPPNLELE